MLCSNLVIIQALADKNNKALQAQLQQNNKRLAEGSLELNDADSANRKSMAENSELLRQLDEVEGEQKNHSCKGFDHSFFWMKFHAASF